MHSQEWIHMRTVDPSGLSFALSPPLLLRLPSIAESEATPISSPSAAPASSPAAGALSSSIVASGAVARYVLLRDGVTVGEQSGPAITHLPTPPSGRPHCLHVRWPALKDVRKKAGIVVKNPSSIEHQHLVAALLDHFATAQLLTPEERRGVQRAQWIHASVCALFFASPDVCAQVHKRMNASIKHPGMSVKPLPVILAQSTTAAGAAGAGPTAGLALRMPSPSLPIWVPPCPSPVTSVVSAASAPAETSLPAPASAPTPTPSPVMTPPTPVAPATLAFAASIPSLHLRLQ